MYQYISWSVMLNPFGANWF